MSIFSKDLDELYDEYFEGDGSMLGKMDFEEFESIESRAEEIASGYSSGLLEKDERVWNRVLGIKDKE